MALYTERSNAHSIVATACIVSVCARSKSKDADLGKIRGTEIYSNAAEKFLSDQNEEDVDYGYKITRNEQGQTSSRSPSGKQQNILCFCTTLIQFN
jgi:hypothetical protein